MRSDVCKLSDVLNQFSLSFPFTLSNRIDRAPISLYLAVAAVCSAACFAALCGVCGGSKSSCLLPPQWKASLHNALAGESVCRSRSCGSFSKPAREVPLQPDFACCHSSSLCARRDPDGNLCRCSEPSSLSCTDGSKVPHLI